MFLNYSRVHFLNNIVKQWRSHLSMREGFLCLLRMIRQSQKDMQHATSVVSLTGRCNATLTDQSAARQESESLNAPGNQKAVRDVINSRFLATIPYKNRWAGRPRKGRGQKMRGPAAQRYRSPKFGLVQWTRNNLH